MSNEIVADIKRDYVYQKLRNNERIDGRGFTEFRKIRIETGIIDKAEGSAVVRIGDTEVMVGIKMQPGEPFPDTPDRGVIISNAELVPLASPTFEPGPPDENSIELARVVDRGIRESEAIDLEKLCITEGEEVWLVFIDIHVLDDDGNLQDASALAAISALLNTTIPNERFGYGDDEILPVRDLPVSVTSLIVDEMILVDPSSDEEKLSKSRITITTDTHDNIVAIQKSGAYTLTEDKLYEVVDISIEKAREIRALLRDV